MRLSIPANIETVIKSHLENARVSRSLGIFFTKIISYFIVCAKYAFQNLYNECVIYIRAFCRRTVERAMGNDAMGNDEFFIYNFAVKEIY